MEEGSLPSPLEPAGCELPRGRRLTQKSSVLFLSPYPIISIHVQVKIFTYQSEKQSVIT
jgi:hypothetical protein